RRPACRHTAGARLEAGAPANPGRPAPVRGHRPPAPPPPRSARPFRHRPWTTGGVPNTSISVGKTKKSGLSPLFQEFSTCSDRRQGGRILIPPASGAVRTLDGACYL